MVIFELGPKCKERVNWCERDMFREVAEKSCG